MNQQIKLPISVFIITKNEEERLPLAIKSVIDWVSEIIVVDSGSTDKTLEIAKNMGSKTFFNEWQGYGQQKIFGENLCNNNWILNIDADKEISAELKQEIINLFSNPVDEKIVAFEMNWKMIFFTQQKPPLFAVGSKFIRLYNKQYAGFRASTIHDSVIIKPEFEKIKKIGKLKNIVHHRCFKSMQHWMEKINQYTTMQAEEWVAKNRPYPTIRCIFEPLFAFLKSYFIRKYIFYGIEGFTASLIYAHSKSLRLAKVRELYDLKKQGNII